MTECNNIKEQRRHNTGLAKVAKSNPENHRNGLGSLLMDLFFDFILFAQVEPSEYFLECTGAVGLGENKQELSVASQTNFFRKFGFRVNNRKGYPDYITMLKKGCHLN